MPKREVPHSGDIEVHSLAAWFDGVAELYEWGRPSFPAESLNPLQGEMALSGRSVLDIGAGTGKFTQLLLDAGAHVTGVEPLAGMREVFCRRFPEVSCLNAAAEALPVEASSFDAVTIAEAFHWFDSKAAWSEIHRVLRPGGVVLLVWLHRQSESGWQERVYELLQPVKADVPSEIGGKWKLGWTPDMFMPLIEHHVQYELSYELDRLRAMFSTHSYVAALPPEEQEALLDQIVAIAADEKTPIRLGIDVEAWTCRRQDG